MVPTTTIHREFWATNDDVELIVFREKARIPAWCDRVLRKGDILKQTSYMTAPLRFSDHRPVSATFQCTVDIVDERLKALLAREIYAMRKSDVEKATANAAAHTLGTQVVEDFEAIAPGLPAASSDRRKWWLDSSECVPLTHEH